MTERNQVIDIESTPRESQALAPTATDTPEALIRYAIERNVDVGTMERLVALQERAMAARAKFEFDAALAAFQKACPIVKKNKPGPNNAYKYAPLEDVMEAVKDLVFEHGFSCSVTSETSEGWIKAVCEITHRGGHSKTSEFKVPIDSRNRMMSDPQRYLGSLTTARRIAFCNGLGIVCAGEDKDVAGKQKPEGPAIVATENTRAWMIKGLADIRDRAIQYFIDARLIMPNEGLERVPLSEVPTTNPGLKDLRSKILRHP
jgi:ERF superfamily